MDEQTIKELVNRANSIKKNAYAPYSRFQVGCAILLNDGRIIEGVNIENASFPVALCAERSAMAQTVTLGLQHDIRALAIATISSPPGSPCGMCRQFLREFLSSDTPIILANGFSEWQLTTIQELLPKAFDKSSLIYNTSEINTSRAEGSKE